MAISDSENNDSDCDYDAQSGNLANRTIENQLEEFRLKWKKEIQQRTVYGYVQEDKENDVLQHEPKEKQKEEQARHFFERAVVLEREGKLYDAIKYYRAAMQLVPDIEFRMARKHTGASGLGSQQITTTDPNYEENLCAHDLAIREKSEESDVLESLQRLNFTDDATICSKNLPQKGTHISSLPSEVVIYIMRWVISNELDVRSLEQCSKVCKGFYVCSRDQELWKLICLNTWGLHTGNPISYGNNWRNMFINRARVCFNGVYISRATYIRQGEQSLDTFYSPWHLVEYYRYIRFFPDGIVIMCTTADEPRITVGKLKSRYGRDSTIVHGNYRLNNNKVIIIAKRITQRTTYIDQRNRRQPQKEVQSDVEQILHLEFEMCDAGKKKHQQLLWTHYDLRFSNKRLNEDRATDLVLDRHSFPPLIFSRVKSYTSQAEQPLK
ncbi:unnamed protein product [Didymodactylos carnosus]|uniref:F-box only protein 9 n=1 Tax=Didymodactylos carnosus TaxID=1234261 RepID=A0A8S2D992_9BILA|nr:unnamed protein product [Didymodactylos carnosus]CAF3653460.1 unnamed protein product [Didymodactylos carnosus]